MMTWTIQKAGIEFGCSRETLKRRLADQGAKPDANGHYSTKQILASFVGDYRAARTREVDERGRLLALKRKERENELMDHDAAMAIITGWFLPIRQKLVALAPEMKHRCNPVDPELAGKALEDWSRDAMRSIQSEIKRSCEMAKSSGEQP